MAFERQFFLREVMLSLRVNKGKLGAPLLCVRYSGLLEEKVVQTNTSIQFVFWLLTVLRDSPLDFVTLQGADKAPIQLRYAGHTEQRGGCRFLFLLGRLAQFSGCCTSRTALIYCLLPQRWLRRARLSRKWCKWTVKKQDLKRKEKKNPKTQ